MRMMHSRLIRIRMSRAFRLFSLCSLLVLLGFFGVTSIYYYFEGRASLYNAMQRKEAR